jgi:hypothetical protein
MTNIAIIIATPKLASLPWFVIVGNSDVVLGELVDGTLLYIIGLMSRARVEA